MQLRPVEFKIVLTTDQAECEHQINALLAKDWVMHGELKIEKRDGLCYFFQPMVKLQLLPPPGLPHNMSDIVVPVPAVPALNRNR